MFPQFAYSNENMKSYHEHQRIKIIRCVLISILFGFLLVVSLHQTSEHMKNYMFSPPEELEEWEDHIQIAILLRGKLIRQKCSFDTNLIIHCKQPLIDFSTDLSK